MDLNRWVGIDSESIPDLIEQIETLEQERLVYQDEIVRLRGYHQLYLDGPLEEIELRTTIATLRVTLKENTEIMFDAAKKIAMMREAFIILSEAQHRADALYKKASHATTEEVPQ